jgi:hypothetical protein
MEILFYSKVLSEHSSVEHIRNDNPEEIWDTRTLYVYSTNIEPEEKKKKKKKKKKNYNFATLENCKEIAP